MPNDSVLGFALFGLVVVGVLIFAAVLAHRANQRRIADLTAWAKGRGFTYSPERRRAPNADFDVFDRGHSRYADHHVDAIGEDAIRGLPDPSIELFHYHYAVTSGSGKDRKTEHFHHRCVLVDTGIQLGAVAIRRENFFDRIAAAIGFDDIDVEDPDFSKRFHVTARDRRDAYSLLGHELTDFMNTADIEFETNGSLLLVLESGMAEAADFERLFAHTSQFLARLPRLLVNSERERRGLAPLLDAGAAARRTATDSGTSATH